MLRQGFAWVVVLAAMCAVAFGLAQWKGAQDQAAMAAAQSFPEPAEAVAVTRARLGTWSVTTRAIGTVVAKRQLEVKNELAGAIAEMGFTSGSIVEAGQLLVALDTRQEAAALEAAEAEARIAKFTLDRRESLRGSPAFSPQEFDRAREEFSAATARARNLAVIIDKKRIKAPFKARVGITDLQPGAYVEAGTLLARLQGVDADAYVDFALPQDAALLTSPGTSVTVSGVAVPGGSSAAKVVAVDDSIDGASRAVRLRAVLANLGDRLRPGAFVDVTAVTSEPRESILVPVTAVRRSPAGQHVFVITEVDGKLRAKQRIVRTGAVVDKEIAVLDGLAVGEPVASAGSFKLRDGMLVNTELPPASEQKVGLN